MDPSVITDFEALMTKIYGSSRAPTGFLTTNLKEVGDQLKRPIASLSAQASRDDVSFAASLFLARKVLPAAPPNIGDYVSKMSRNQTPNTRFVRFSERKLALMFPKGWDTKYVAYCHRALPTTGASFGTRSSDGGSRAEIASEMSRSDFVTACSTGRGIQIKPGRRVNIVTDGGKSRIISVADAAQQVLGPLHHLLYDHIARADWLLRGEVTGNRAKKFQRVKGEVFVSGDYESATDNFNRHHSEAILRAIFKNSANIPAAIQELALQSLTGYLVVDETWYRQVAGQLMGNLLSFPLLCITNFLAFKMAVPRRVPLLINGDDIVFRSTPKEAQTWMAVVGESGLTLSPGKTFVHERYFSLNSTFLEGRLPSVFDDGTSSPRKPSIIPVVRAKCIYAPLQRGFGLALAARARSSCKGMTGARKGLVIGHILKWHRRSASEIGCSLNRALGIRVTHPSLVEANLLEQEIFYLRLPRTQDVPRKVTKAPLPDGVVPVTHGWREASRSLFSRERARELDGYWQEHCLAHAWQCANVVGGDAFALDPPVVAFRRLDNLKRRAALLKRTVVGFRRILNCVWRRHPEVRRWLYGRKVGGSTPDKIWVTEGTWAWNRPPLRFWTGEAATDGEPVTIPEIQMYPPLKRL